MRQLVINLTRLVIISPLLPFYFLYSFGEWLLEATHWLIEDRVWSNWLIRQANNFELWTLQKK